MSFIEHAQILIPALSGLAVTVWNGEPRSLREFETNAKVLLAGCGAGDTFLLPYKLYRCSLPILEQGFAVRTAVCFGKSD